jgi:hypothetical protein
MPNELFKQRQYKYLCRPLLMIQLRPITYIILQAVSRNINIGTCDILMERIQITED